MVNRTIKLSTPLIESMRDGVSFSAKRPAFLITIDTEGDHLWSRPREVTTRNAKFLPRFQRLCEQWCLKPTYLVDYDMAHCPAFVDFAKDAIHRNVAEVGMHLHPWNTPPSFALTADDLHYQPYLIEYPPKVMRDKIVLMTDLLGETFDITIRSHRAGRWAFDETYAQLLIENGYWVDCSVTPHVSWGSHRGDPSCHGGVDYQHFPQAAYFVDPQDISRFGESGLLEIPMTIRPCQSDFVTRVRRRFGERALISRLGNRFAPAYTWFRPKRGNLADMLDVLRWVKWQGMEYVEFMLHSSEFMPSGSPTFVTEDDIERLYDDLSCLFETAASASFRGAGLTDFYLAKRSVLTA